MTAMYLREVSFVLVNVGGVQQVDQFSTGHISRYRHVGDQGKAWKKEVAYIVRREAHLLSKLRSIYVLESIEVIIFH
jgi:hypothetical protein